MLESLQKQFDIYRDKGLVSKLIVQNAGPDVNTQIAQLRNLIATQATLTMHVNPTFSTRLEKAAIFRRESTAKALT